MDIIEAPKKYNIILDSQILTALMTCPRKCDYTFNLNYRPAGGKSNALECGSIVHAILEFYYKSRIAGKSRNEAIQNGFAAGKEYLTAYSPDNKYIIDPEHKGITNTPAENSTKPKRTGYNYVFKTMEQYFDHWRNSDNWTPLFVEYVKKKEIYVDDEMRIMWAAKYDLIEDSPAGFISTDHKTASQNRDTLSLNNQFMGQCVTIESRQIQINKIGFQSSLEPHEKFTRPLLAYSADRLAEWMKETVPFYARMLVTYNEAEYFPPNHSNCENKYGYCDYKKVCEHDRNMRLEVLKREYELVKEWDISND